MRVVEVSAVFHSRHNPFRFVVDNDGNVVERPKNAPRCLAAWPDVKSKLSDHTRCDGTEKIPCTKQQ